MTGYPIKRTTGLAFLLAAAGVWASAIGLWVVGGEAVPGAATAAGLLASSLIATAGIFCLPGAPPHASGRARTAVDGLIVAASALLVGWALGLRELYEASAGSDRTLIVAAAVGGVGVGAAAIVMLTRARPAARLRLAQVACGLTAIAVGTCAMAYLALGGTSDAAGILYAAWPIGWAVVVLSVWHSRDDSPEEELEPGLPTRASVFIPSVPFAIGVLAATAEASSGNLEGFLIWNAAAVIVLIVMRQVLALWENISFWRGLESKVKARTDDLRRSETRFRSLVQNSSDVIAVIGPDWSLRYVSPSAKGVFGYRQAGVEVVPQDIVAAEDLPRVTAIARELLAKPGATMPIECRARRADGRLCDVEAMVTNLVHDEAVGGFVVNIRDITERKTLERELTHRAFHDPLTGLANRALFGDRLEHALSSRDRAPDSLAVLFLDLDDFKYVNDSLGHDSGDDLLVAVAKRLLGCARPPDTVARLGGDEFGILLEQIDGALGAARVAERLLAAFEKPQRMGDREVFVRASIGIATHSEVSGTGEELLGNADVAMYTAKARGKGRFEHFEHRMHAALVERLDIEQNLRDAIEKEQFVLHYQPVVSLQSGAVPAVEALVRWRHPERGEIAPGHFIELAEETGLIVPIGRWVLNAACRQAAEWKRQLGREKPLTMMVNLSAKQLEDPEFVGHVRAALDGAGLDPGELLLEITERLVVDDEDTIATMKSIRGLGVRIGIDDFGTKYSSLSYLRRFPIDVLKIDQEFMRGVTHGSPEAALVRAIIAMSDSMRLTAIAEGVENAEQEEELRRMGCGLAQGFLFARPAPAHEIAELIVDSGASSLIEKATTSGW